MMLCPGRLSCRLRETVEIENQYIVACHGFTLLHYHYHGRIVENRGVHGALSTLGCLQLFGSTRSKWLSKVGCMS